MPITESIRFNASELRPFFDDSSVKRTAVRLAPNRTFTRGQVLALTLPASAVHTVTGNVNITGGTFQFVVFGQSSDPVALNANAALMQAALATIPAIGSVANVTVTGGPLNTATPIVITFTGSLANTPVPLVSLVTTALVGTGIGAITIVNTTDGIAGMTYDSYSSAVVAVPTTAIVPSIVAGGSIDLGAYRLVYTGRNARGETTLSAQVSATVTTTGGNQIIRVAAMAGLPVGLTALDIYVVSPGLAGGAPTFLGSAPVTGTSSAQTDFVAPPAATVFKTPPLVNTAFTSAANTALMLLQYDARTDGAGNAALGTNPGLTMEQGEVQETVPAYYGGTFALSDLVGFDANALTDLRGRLIAGAIGGAGLLTF